MVSPKVDHDIDGYTTVDVAIIGGGIGGLSLLIGLLQHASTSRIRPHLFESAPAFSEIGAGVGFGPNAVQAMRIISPELYDAYEQIASDSDFLNVNGVTKTVWNEMVLGMDGRKETNGLKAGDPLTKVIFEQDVLPKKNVHRARLLDEMIKQLPGGTGQGYVSFLKRCVDIDTGLENGRVRVRFADGSSVEVDAVVGCDGVKSCVRRILLTNIGDTENISPRFSGKYAYRGLIPMDEAKAALGPIATRSHMHWGYDGHLVLFPVDRGATMNVVAFRTKHDNKWESDEWVVSATVEQALEDYQEWCEPIRKLLGGLRKPDKWALFEHPPAKSYCDGKGKICLLGDCAHASTPHQGAGAGMAIEDAAVLSSLLNHVRSPSDLEAAFKVYDELRRPRSQRLVTTSNEAGRLYEFQLPGVLDDPQKCVQNVNQRLKWVWEFDLEEECRRAVTLFKDLCDQSDKKR